MANCKSCGKPAGMFSSLCESCKEGIEAHRLQVERDTLEKRRRENEEERAKRSQQEEAQRREAERLRQEMIDGLFQKSVRLINSGGSVFLHRTLYFPVDSLVVEDFVCGSFDISSLKCAGLDGWEVVGTVPKTAGIALSNVSVGSSTGQTWGAGLGGNVIGVYVLLKLMVRQSHINDGLLRGYIEENLSSWIID